MVRNLGSGGVVRQTDDAEQRKQVRKIFEEFDDDASGAWELSEMVAFIDSLSDEDRKGLGLSDPESVFSKLDEDGSGVLDFEEFYAWYEKVFCDTEDGHLGDWHRAHDAYGDIYYVHSRTGEATWRAPDGAYELKKLPGSIGTYSLVMGKGAAKTNPDDSSAKEQRIQGSRARGLSLAASAVQRGASMIGSALLSFRKAAHAKENRAAKQAFWDSQAQKALDLKALRRANRDDPNFEMPKEKWATVTFVLLEGTHKVTEGHDLICKVHIMDAKQPDQVRDWIQFRVDNSSPMWNEYCTFEVQDALSLVSVIFYRETLHGSRARGLSLAPLTEYGIIAPFLMDSDFTKWFKLNEPVDKMGNVICTAYELGHVKIKCSRKIDAQAAHQKMSEQRAGNGLPAGWLCKVTPEGRVFFVNPELQVSQWNHPALEEIPLPDGWEKDVDVQGRRFYVDMHSGKAGIPESHTTQYLNPADSSVAAATRHHIVSVHHDVTSVLKQNVDLNDASLEYDSLKGVAEQQCVAQLEKEVLLNPELKTYSGRLKTFLRPAVVIMQDGREINIGGWPHGFHCLSDRPELAASLRQHAVRNAGRGQDLRFSGILKLRGAIPVLEGFAYMRYGDADTRRWEQLYLEVQHSYRADGESQFHLAWGHLDVANVRLTKVAMKAMGKILTTLITDVTRFELSQGTVDSIIAQHEVPVFKQDSNSQAGKKTVSRGIEFHGLRIFSGNHDMVLVFVDKSTCATWASTLRAPKVRQVGRLSPEMMADAGFVFFPTPARGLYDRVICPFCGLSLQNWNASLDAFVLHADKNPACPFVTDRHRDAYLRDHPKGRVIPGLGSAGISSPRSTLFSSADQSDNPRHKRAAQGRGSFEFEPDVDLDRLGVKYEHKDTTVMKLDRLAKSVVPHPSATTKTVPHQRSLMEHRRRMEMLQSSDANKLLEMAASNDVNGVVDMLDKGAPIDHTDAGMRTALHWAASFGNVDVIRILVNNGADPNCKTAMGFTPLMLAERGGFTRCVYELELSGGQRVPDAGTRANPTG
jgi:hypothetical protein